MDQGLRGFVGQGMDGRKAAVPAIVAMYLPGAHSFRPTVPGFYKFVLWGPGGSEVAAGGLGSGGSGAYVEITKPLAAGQVVALVVSDYGAPTTATFPDGKVASAGHGADCPGGGAGGVGGAATGGDVNLDGATGGSSVGPAQAALGTAPGAPGSGNNAGAGAPANLPFRGGRGGNPYTTASITTNPQAPGGGGGAAGSASSVKNGSGMVIVQLVRTAQ